MADLAPLRTARDLIGVEWDSKGVTLRWDDALPQRLSANWLRDNCACPECRHPQALERTYTFVDHPPPALVHAVIGDEQMLEVQFVAGAQTHFSRYAKGWLRSHAPAERAAQDAKYRPRLWARSMHDRLVCVAFDEYMQSGSGVRAWIEAVKTDGIVLLRGVPQLPGSLLEVARRIGPVRASNFGEYYDVVSLRNPNASAYTPMGLELHTDLANWRSPPDVQLLCCLKSSVQGGDSVFADGFRVAQDLRSADARAFGVLTTHPVEFRFHDREFDIRHTGPMLELDRDGALVRVRFNNWLRAAFVGTTTEVEAAYDALAKFWHMLRDPQYRLDWRLEPGDLIAYDNNRILHGRAPFDANSGERHLQGCYLNREDVDSTLRLLDRRQA
jgi:gamma-butyrobetaine hydroxylase